MATFIKASGEAQNVLPENCRAYTLKELKGYVNGFIEVVETIDGGMLVINEEGKLRGYQVNVLATELYKYGHGDCIVGDVLYVPANETYMLQ